MGALDACILQHVGLARVAEDERHLQLVHDALAEEAVLVALDRDHILVELHQLFDDAEAHVTRAADNHVLFVRRSKRHVPLLFAQFFVE